MIFIIKNKEDFEEKLNQANDKLVVVDFFATWCGPCKIISPKLEELAEAYVNEAIVLKVDVEECDDIAEEYNITSMPTFLFIRKKKIVEVFVGGNAEKLNTTMAKLIGEGLAAMAQPTKVPVNTETTVDAATCEQLAEKI